MYGFGYDFVNNAPWIWVTITVIFQVIFLLVSFVILVDVMFLNLEDDAEEEDSLKLKDK